MNLDQSQLAAPIRLEKHTARQWVSDKIVLGIARILPRSVLWILLQ